MKTHHQIDRKRGSRDYLFVTPGLAACLQEVRYDAISNASDHQPVWARFEGAPRA